MKDDFLRLFGPLQALQSDYSETGDGKWKPAEILTLQAVVACSLTTCQVTVAAVEQSVF